MPAYYNEHDPKAAAWLRELIRNGLIADGFVDERSIEDITPADLAGYTQCHFFAGIGGWSYALRLAGWPDVRPVWTGSCPCTTHSSAARGANKERDWWPCWARLISASKPGTVFGEQVANTAHWFDGVCDDMEAMGYAVGAAVLPACSVGKDHKRERLYFVGHSDEHGKPSRTINAKTSGMCRHDRDPRELVLSDGFPHRMAYSGFGNAIVPQVAAEFIKAVMS